MNDTDDTRDVGTRISEPRTIILYVFALIGIIGNVIVLLVYRRISKKQIQGQSKEGGMRVRFFIPSLAVFDITSIIFLAVFPLSATNVWLCKGVVLVGLSAIKTSGLIMLLISIQRFMFIAMQPKRILTPKQLHILLAVVILVGIAFTLPETFVFEIYDITISFRNKTTTFPICSKNHLYSGKVMSVIIFTATLLNLLVMFALYSAIGRAILTRLKKANKTHQKACSQTNSENRSKGINILTSVSPDDNVEKNNSRPIFNLQINNKGLKATKTSTDSKTPPKGEKTNTRTGSEMRNKQRKKTKSRFTLMFLIIVIINLLSYVPTQILGLQTHIGEDETTSYSSKDWELFAWFYVIAMTNHIANPFVYGYFDSLFRHECKTMFCRTPCRNI